MDDIHLGIQVCIACEWECLIEFRWVSARHLFFGSKGTLMWSAPKVSSSPFGIQETASKTKMRRISVLALLGLFLLAMSSKWGTISFLLIPVNLVPPLSAWCFSEFSKTILMNEKPAGRLFLLVQLVAITWNGQNFQKKLSSFLQSRPPPRSSCSPSFLNNQLRES